MDHRLRKFLRIQSPDERERQEEEAKNAHRIAVLRKWIPTGGVGAELGVHKGYFSPFLLEQLKPARLYLIDTWFTPEGEEGLKWSWGNGNRSTVDGLCRVIRTLQDDLASGRARLRIGSDLDELAAMPDGHLDWAYVDSSHAYGHTLKELSILQRKIKPEGIIAGDDWREDPNHRHHGVCRAVREFLSHGSYKLLFTEGQQWGLDVVAKRSAVQ